MRKILLPLLLLIITINSYSQSNKKIEDLTGRTFVFLESKTYTKDKNSFDVSADDLVKIVSDEDGIIKYERKSNNSELLSDSKIYEIAKSEFLYNTENSIRRYKGAEVGVYTIPFRLRGSGDDFDFESSLSLQMNIVFGFGSQKSEESVLDLSAGIGLSSINLNSNNSKVTESRTASALTLSLGAVIKPAKNANIGLFIGGDFLGQSDKAVDWKYDKNLWLGIGINISFNKIETTKASKIKKGKTPK